MEHVLVCAQHGYWHPTDARRPLPPGGLCPVCAGRAPQSHVGEGTETHEQIVNAGGVLVEVDPFRTAVQTPHERRIAKATEAMWERMRADGRMVDPEAEAAYVAESTAQSRESAIYDRLPKHERARKRNSSAGRWTADGWLDYT